MFNPGDFILYKYDNVCYTGVVLAKQLDPAGGYPYTIGYITSPKSISGGLIGSYDTFIDFCKDSTDMNYLTLEAFNKIVKKYNITYFCTWSDNLTLITEKQVITSKLDDNYE